MGGLGAVLAGDGGLANEGTTWLLLDHDGKALFGRLAIGQGGRGQNAPHTRPIQRGLKDPVGNCVIAIGGGGAAPNDGWWLLVGVVDGDLDGLNIGRLIGSIVKNNGNARLADLEIIGGDDDLHGRDSIANDKGGGGVFGGRAPTGHQQTEGEEPPAGGEEGGHRGAEEQRRKGLRD